MVGAHDDERAGIAGDLSRGGVDLGEVREDLPASWLMESLIGIVVSGLRTRPSLGVEDTVEGIASLFLDGARLRDG